MCIQFVRVKSVFGCLAMVLGFVGAAFGKSLPLLALFVLCSLATSQEAAVRSNNTRYRIKFLPGTFGGPNNHILLRSHILNNEGSFTGWSDTPLPDPFPDNCWDGETCLVGRAYEFSKGRMTDLGVLAPGFSSDTNWISPSGLISGEAQTGQTADPSIGGWTMHGILWAHGKMIDLGTLDGGPISLTTGVNDAAEVSGYAMTNNPDPFSMFMGNQTRAYRWQNGVMEDLGTLGGPDAVALRINQRGQIAGNSHINFDPSDACGLRTGGFIWDNGKMRDLGSLGGSCTMVTDMNDRGQIVGGSLLAGDQAQHPFLWERGRLKDLGTSGGNFALPIALNQSGDAVGFQTLAPDDGVIHAALWSDGQIYDLGALAPGGCSEALSVNSRRQVVGQNWTDCIFETSSPTAVISDRGGPLVDLNTLIPANSGVQLRDAANINDRGEIVVFATYPNGNKTLVLLIPCESDRREACENSALPTEALQQAIATPTESASPLRKAAALRAKQLFGPLGSPTEWRNRKP